jgi:hypothetical protein
MGQGMRSVDGVAIPVLAKLDCDDRKSVIEKATWNLKANEMGQPMISNEK